jgi:valyl-tRNA synthetase
MEKDLAAADAEAEQAQRKLANESFLARAPAEVVAKTRDRLGAAQADVDRLAGRLSALPRDDG